MRVHDKALQDLDNIVREEYLTTYKNFEYGPKIKVVGEIDLIGVKSNTLDFYEVKSNALNYNIRKAIEQLERSRDYFRLSGDNYIYTPETGIITIIEAIKEFC